MGMSITIWLSDEVCEKLFERYKGKDALKQIRKYIQNLIKEDLQLL